MSDGTSKCPVCGQDTPHHHSLALSEADKKAQAARCSCRGTDDYCPCQNVPDRETVRARTAKRGAK